MSLQKIGNLLLTSIYACYFLVQINKQTVGYLPSTSTNKGLAKHLKGKTLGVPARVMGGFKLDPADQRAEGRDSKGPLEALATQHTFIEKA